MANNRNTEIASRMITCLRCEVFSGGIEAVWGTESFACGSAPSHAERQHASHYRCRGPGESRIRGRDTEELGGQDWAFAVVWGVWDQGGIFEECMWRGQNQRPCGPRPGQRTRPHTSKIEHMLTAADPWRSGSPPTWRHKQALVRRGDRRATPHRACRASAIQSMNICR